MFLGEYQHTVDGKGRMVLPRTFGDDLEEGCVVTIGQEKCLFVFPMDRFNEEVERMDRLPRTDRRARNFTRAFFAGASDQTPDRQGRVQLTEKQRRYAGLGKDVTVVGVAERIEIWDTETWNTVAAEADEYYADIEEALSEEGI